MKNKAGFTLLEIIIVVVIIALVSTFSINAWRSNLIKAEFDDAVLSIIAIFQEARSYSLKSIEIDGDINGFYYIDYATDPGDIVLSGDESGDIATYNFSDAVEIDTADWQVAYEVPYGECETPGEEDLVLTVNSVKSGLSETITVHNLSGIAEVGE